jgi:hypothetical protein
MGTFAMMEFNIQEATATVPDVVGDSGRPQQKRPPPREGGKDGRHFVQLICLLGIAFIRAGPPTGTKRNDPRRRAQPDAGQKGM